MNPTDTGSAAEPEAPGRLEGDEFVAWVRRELRACKTRTADWRTAARECYRFYAGSQWSDEDRAYLEEQNRVPVTFNRTARTVNAVSGLEIANRQEVRYIPRGPEDAGPAEVQTTAAKWARDQTDAEDEESEAFRDLAICGMGWTETRLDYEDDADGLVMTERVDPLELFWGESDRRCLTGSRWRARVTKVSEMELRELWPEYAPGEKPGDSWLEDDDEPHDSSPPFYDADKKPGTDPKPLHELTKFEYWTREKYVRVATSGGKIVEFSSAKWVRLRPQVEAMGLKWAEQTRKHYRTAYLCGATLLEHTDSPVQSGFTLQPMTGMRDREGGAWFGLVHLMMDPQRWANKWLSQVIHILNSNAKGGLLAETGAFVNAKKAEEDWARPDRIIHLNAGGLAKVQEKAQAQFPAGFDRLMQYAVDAISDTPGVNLELMGLVGQEQPGVLESMRKQAGVQMMGVLFDAKRAYAKNQGRVLAEFMRNFLSDGRLVRIVGDQGAQYVPLAKDAMTQRYDIVVDEAPTSHNHKERVLALLMQLVPPLVQAGMAPPPPEVLEYLPLPQAFIEKWRTAAKPPPEVVQQRRAYEEAMKQTEVQGRQAESALKMAQAKKAEADAAATIMEAQKPAADPQSEMLVEYQLGREKATLEAQTEIQKAMIQSETQRVIEQMRLTGQIPDDGIVRAIQQITASVGDQMQRIVAGLDSVAAAAAQAQRAAAEAQTAAAAAMQPRRKRVNVQRGPDGMILGADVVEDIGTLQ